MSFGAVLEVLGTVRREDHEVRVLVVECDERRFIRIESRKLDGGRWSKPRTLALRPDEGPEVVAALSRAIESVALEPGRRRKLNEVRRKLRAHDKAHGREDWKGRTRRDD